MQRFLLYSLLIYCFVLTIIGREIGGLPYGIFIEALLLITFITAIFISPKKDWERVNCDLFYILIVWFSISVLEILQPNASKLGWLVEFRTVALYPLTMVILGLVILKNHRDLDVFLIIVISLSTLAALNGVKQLYFGPSRGEQEFLNSGGDATHVLWGRLRVFSFYNDAGQFGASQAHVGLMALILSLGPFKRWKKLILFICAMLMLYGMLISGTRGALFALVIGAFTAIVLSKKFKVLIFGGLVAFIFLFGLKYTMIGNGNYQIYRLRSAVNPADPSLNLRFQNQLKLSSYMSDHPFGGGLGITGYNGHAYNETQYLSTIEPDSYFVKVWAMYGIVGLVIWLSSMLYIFGKACGIVWRIQNEELRIKIIALTAGFGGILFCSYGNEVINNMPSSVITYLGWALIFISPILDKEKNDNILIS